MITKEFRNILTSNGKRPSEIIEKIREYSCVYANTLTDIVQNPKENIFVYNKYVQGSGAILFSELLKLVGYQRSRGYDNIDERKKGKENKDEDDDDLDEDDIDISPEDLERKPRFAIITGETVSEAEVGRVVDKLFNDPKNKYGEYIQVIVGSQIIGEGKSLMNVRQIHIQTPHWNNSETEQAIARGIRAFSHEDLPAEERYVKVSRHAAVPGKKSESINYILLILKSLSITI